MPSDTVTPTPSPSPSPTAAADTVGGEADNGQEEPDCEQNLPYSYDTKAAEASQGSDCDDALSIADEKSAAPVTGNQAPPGNKGYGGGAHGHNHGGDSYSFKSAMGNPYREAGNNNSEGAGVVVPYPGA